MNPTFKTPGVVLAVHLLLEVVVLQKWVRRMLEGWQWLWCAAVTASQVTLTGTCSSTTTAQQNSTAHYQYDFLIILTHSDHRGNSIPIAWSFILEREASVPSTVWNINNSTGVITVQSVLHWYHGVRAIYLCNKVQEQMLTPWGITSFQSQNSE
jgi:hypothetical protein